MKYNNYSALIENCLFSLISVSIINKNFQVSRHKKKVARRLSNNFLVLGKVTSQNERMLEFNYLDSISNKSTRQVLISFLNFLLEFILIIMFVIKTQIIYSTICSLSTKFANRIAI